MTKHAQVRSQQRGIPPMVQDLLMKFGTSIHLGGGCTKLFFDKRTRRKVQAYAGPIASFLNDHLDAYLVMSTRQRTTDGGTGQSLVYLAESHVFCGGQMAFMKNYENLIILHKSHLRPQERVQGRVSAPYASQVFPQFMGLTLCVSVRQSV
jgi:hypothetical protein